MVRGNMLVAAALLACACVLAQDGLQQRFEQLDANEDGRLSADEVPWQRWFERADADGDGFVSPEEAQATARGTAASRRAEELAELGTGPVVRSDSDSFTDVAFTRDYVPGQWDDRGQWSGGTETLRLIAHDGKVFASLGYWMDKPYRQDKGDEPWTGAQMVVKESAASPWHVDANFGRDTVRTEGLTSATLTTDASGAPLHEPVPMLVAGPSGLGVTSAWTRDDATGEWAQSELAGFEGGIRSFCTHSDSVTGVQHIFAGLSRGQVVAGAYDTNAPGRLRWSEAAELSGTGRVMAMVEANGVLYAACGIDSDDPASGGLFMRIDGPEPRWEQVWRWPYKLVEDKDESEIMRGLTAVPDPNGGDHEVIVGTCAYPGVVYRIDPANDHESVRELDIRAYFAEAWGVDLLTGPCLSAYNRIVPATDPDTGERVHLIPVWVAHPDGQGTEPGQSAWYLVRHADGSYGHGRVYYPALPLPNPPRGLTATRTLEASPFPEDAGRVIYAGGFDCAKQDSHNTAWIYRGVLGADVQAAAPLGLRPASEAGGRVLKHADIAYARMQGVDPASLSLDLYAPEGVEGAPIMLYVHGGGWSRGDKQAVARKPELFCGSGWLFASANYRMLPEVTPAEEVRDVARAIAWLHEHAAEFGGDPGRIYLMGHSAGAHLVALVSTYPAPLEEVGLGLAALSGTVVIDTGAVDLEPHMANVGGIRLFRDAFGEDPAFWREMSPMTYVAPDAGIPPMLLLTRGAETRVEHSRHLAEALVMCGVDATVVNLPEHSHESINRRIGVPDDPVTEAVVAFLASVGETVSAPGGTPDTGPLDMTDLKAAAEYSADNGGVSMLVMVNGQIVFEDYPNEGAVDAAWELASGTKSFCGVMAAAAAEDGLLDLDERVSDTITEWRDVPGKQDMTIRQLLSLVGGQETGGENGRVPSYSAALAAPLVAQPGERSKYGAVPFQVFGEVMRRKLEGSPLDYMESRVFEAIGLEHGRWLTNADGNPRMPSGAALTAREWAKLGELMRLEGEWDGEQVIAEQMLDQCLQPSAQNPCYGLTWWLVREATWSQLPSGDLLSRLMARVARVPGVPDDLFLAGGAGGQRLYVSRSLGIVVVRQASGVTDYLWRGKPMTFSDVRFMATLLGSDAA